MRPNYQALVLILALLIGLVGACTAPGIPQSKELESQKVLAKETLKGEK